MTNRLFLLWIFILLCSLVPLGAHAPELDGVKIHEVVRPIRLHNLHKRDLESARPAVERYAMRLDGKDIEMQLERNDGLLTSDYTETTYSDNGTRITSAPTDLDFCYYQGKILNDSSSIISVSTCDGLRGYIQTAAQRYLIEPLSEDGDGDHAILKYDDAVNDKPAVCGVTNTSWEDSETDYPPRTSKSRSRMAGPSLLQQQKYNEFYIVADNRAYKKMDSDRNKLRNRIYEIVNFVNAVYRPLNTFIAVTGFEIWDTSDLISVTTPAGATLNSFTNWRNKELKKTKRHDNAHLISGINFDGSTVGLAYIGTLCGGHSTAVVQDHNARAIAVGATLAHEMGHNLGMNHDTSSCSCTGSSCIMAAALSYSIPQSFSSCSMANYDKFLNSRNPECLLNKPERSKLVTPPVCGNGFLETNEECDCGTLEECTNPCCNATSCRLKEGSECAEGDCCQNCKMAPMTHVCRPQSDECDLPEYCTGAEAQCPEDNFAVNGLPCQDKQGYCFNGLCPRREDQCVKMWGSTAVLGSSGCYNENTRGTYYAFCKRKADQYIPCQKESVMCGKLFCDKGKGNPNYGRLVSFGKCKATFYGNPEDDRGQVDTGTKCGEGMVCSQNECVDLQTAYRATNCSAKCKGHGVCNHKLECQCEPGWLPPNCDQSDGSLSKDGIIGIAVTVCILILTGLAMVGVYLWKRRQSSPRFSGHQTQRKHVAVKTPQPFNPQRLTPPQRNSPTPVRPKARPPPVPSAAQPQALQPSFIQARQALRPPPPRV